jgi:hypothetical protein
MALSKIATPVKFNGSILEFYKLYCTLFKDIFSLSNKELEIISNFLLIRNELSEKIKDKKHLNKILFSSETKRIITANTDLQSKYSLDSNYISSFLKKGIILKDKDNNKFFNPALDIYISTDSTKLMLNIEYNVRRKE